MVGQRIGLVLPGLRAGGVESVFLNLARCFLTRGHEVDLVLLSLDGDYRDLIPQGCTIFGPTTGRTNHELLSILRSKHTLRQLPSSRFTELRKWIEYRYSWAYADREICTFRLARHAEIVRRYIKERKPRAMLSGPAKANWAAVIGRDMVSANGRLIVTVHSNYTLGRSAYTKRGSRLLYPNADWVVGVSRGAAECARDVLRLPAQLVTHIYNGFPVSRIREMSVMSNANNALHSDVPTVLSVGRHLHGGAKDVDTLIKAFALVRKTMIARLVYLCPGFRHDAEGKRLNALCHELQVEGDVEITGFVENPFSYMGRASVLVVSSRWEGLPSVLIEAMACGTPTISTRTPFGPEEILDGGRYGALVPVGDVNRMADAICDALHGKHLDAAQLRSRAETFSIERATDQYEELLLGP